LFKTTETYRAGAEGREKIDNLLRTIYSLLEDLMFLQSGTEQLVRNTDILGELKKLAESADFAWVQRASQVWAKWSAECAGTCCARCRWMPLQRRWSAFREQTGKCFGSALRMNRVRQNSGAQIIVIPCPL
jgi:hypothetical protein